VTESSAKNHDLASLDTLTGGAFTAPTSGERAARLRDWLQSEPTLEQLQAVAHDMAVRDRGAAKVVKERLDELRRLKDQDALIQTWAEKGLALRDAARVNIADAMAWQRDAAKAGAPLSREPLASLKTALADRVKAIEDLQHQAQVEREAAVLLAQRIEVLSTKPWQDALAQRDAVQADLQRWQAQVDALEGNAQWPSVDPKFTPALQGSAQQLKAVWHAFEEALTITQAAAADLQAPLPAVPAWADQIRVARGELVAHVAAAKAEVAPAATHVDSSRVVKPTADKAEIDAKRLALCEQAEALFKQETVTANKVATVVETPADAVSEAPSETPAVSESASAPATPDVSSDPAPTHPSDAANVQWVPVVTGRKLQDNLRQLRESWKKIDKEAAPNPALWKRFDAACTRAHTVVDAWLKELRAQSNAAKAQRLALINEVTAWTATVGQGPDWKRVVRELPAFSQRWREGGHLSEKLFAELQPKWKAAIHAAHEPLEAAQKASIERRKALIDEAHTLAAEPRLRIDAIKALQQRWQEEAHSVALERRQEQKMWDAFRQPIDEAFTRLKAAGPRGPREATSAPLSPQDQAVVAAAKALEAAAQSGDATRIHAAMAALEAASKGQAATVVAEPKPHAASVEPKEAAKTEASSAAQAGDEHDAAVDAQVHEQAQTQVDANTEATAETPSEQVAAPTDETSQASSTATPAKPPTPSRPVVAVRGDDRPGQKRTEPAGAHPRGRDAKGRDAKGGPGGKPGFGRDRDADMRGPRAPRLGDVAFRALRHAQESAQVALRKLAAQAHGEVLTHLMDAWQARDASALPAAQALGKAASPHRAQWAQAVQTAPSASAAEQAATALLRLEIAADLPTPAAQLTERRALQLQLLTRRNDPAPTQTWAQDVAKVLGGAHDEAHARRLQAALKVLLKR
jgi:ATP-dependent RNA helicase SUPV3L1/SUV3